MSTLKDIAQEAGVSVCTISRYINNKIRVRQDTAKRIDAAIKKLHYIPNNAAKTLKTNSSFNIAVLIPTMNNLFFAESTEAIRHILNENGFSMFVYTFGNDIEQEKQLIPRLVENRVAGVIFNTLPANYQDLSHFDVLVSHNIPYVFVNRLFHKSQNPSVYADYKKGAYLAVSHLIEQGKRNVGLFLGKKRQPQSKISLDGYIEALQNHGLQYDKNMVKECAYDHDLIGEQTAELLNRGADALYCITDFMAVDVMEYIKRQSMSIPEDVAVIGNGNTRFSTIVEPKMSTVDIHNQDLSRTAAALLLKLIRGEEVDTTVIKTDISLIERDST